MREIVFDTETTGFDAKGADRITEIGCIEIIDFLPTGKEFHCYLDPERDVPEKVVELTGLTTDFLKGMPKFSTQAQGFLDFIGDSILIAHNARFDMGFINAELERAGFKTLPASRFKDTLKMAHEKFPGSPASLDALCKRFDISLSARDKHGAIIDSQLLAAVYLELNGGRAMRLGLDSQNVKTQDKSLKAKSANSRGKDLENNLTELDVKTHKEFIDSLGDEMIWNKLWRKEAQYKS